MNTEITVAIIATIGVVTTVIGSTWATNSTNKTQLEAQRIEAVRDMKRTYYTAFIEALTKKMEYVFMPSSIEQVEANMKFVEEANKLPLYASQDVVEFIEKMKDSKDGIIISKLFELIRTDLCSDKFTTFNNLKEIEFTIPDRVTVHTKKEKVIQSRNN